MDNLIDLIKSVDKDNISKFISEAVSYFDKSLSDTDGFFLEGRELSDDLLTDKIEKLLNLRRAIEESQVLDKNNKFHFLNRINTLANKVLKYDVNNSFLRAQMIKGDRALISELIRVSKHDLSTFVAIRDFLFNNKDLNTSKFNNSVLYELLGNSNTNIIKEIDELIREEDTVKLNDLKTLTEVLKVNGTVDYNSVLKIEGLLELIEVDSELRCKLDTLENYNEVKKMLLEKLRSILKNCPDNIKIRRDIETGKLYISPNRNPGISLNDMSFNFEEYPIVYDQKIITIDDANSPDLDSAFSIKNFDGLYSLDVYIADVPSFLNKNRKLANDAYNRGVSYYIRDFKNHKNLNIDMLPPSLSHFYLSLNKGYVKNVVAFNFLFDQNGRVISTTVGKKRIKVTHAVTPNAAQKIINGKLLCSPIEDELKDLSKLKSLVLKNAKEDENNCIFISDLVGVTSVLVNTYVAENAKLAIYRDHGTYTKEKCGYTHSSTPLRRIVSDINLGLFLNQNGLLALNDRDIYKIEDNIDEIIEHVNRADKAQKYVDKNSRLVRKILEM